MVIGKLWSGRGNSCTFGFEISSAMLFPNLQDYCNSLPHFSTFGPGRVALLDPLAGYISQNLKTGVPVRLVFICTHNSRRSHYGQVWAKVAAELHGISPVETFSGGTEITACNPRTVAALERAGIRAQAITEGDNPVYLLQYAGGVNPVVAFSKIYDQAPNPDSGFAAVMTCAQAAANCPFVPGAEKRFSITYEDPKISDGTAAEAAVYDARCRQVAAEMFYVFGRVQEKIT
jgi:arsenate reductase